MTSSSTQLKPTEVPTEAQEQAALFEWASYNLGKYPALLLMYHIPNERKNALEAMRLKAQGVKAGVPDVCLPVPNGKYAALYIEMKRTKRWQLSDVQREWIAALNRAGNKAVVCKGWEEARDAIIEYLSK